eukprot:4921090-Lingulodinium_polyedra.AAC.1
MAASLSLQEIVRQGIASIRDEVAQQRAWRSAVEQRFERIGTGLQQLVHATTERAKQQLDDQRAMETRSENLGTTCGRPRTSKSRGPSQFFTSASVAYGPVWTGA